MKKIILLFIVAALGFVMVGCQGCKEKINCKPEADFSMYHWIGYEGSGGKRFEVDTLIKGHQMEFSAVGEWDSVKWKVGLDPRVFTGKEFSLEFDVVGKIDVRMIGFRSPDEGCAPENIGIDTAYKSFIVIPLDSISLMGEYEGYLKSQPDSLFSFFIKRDDNVVCISEFPKGCVRVEDELAVFVGNSMFFMDYDGYGINCPRPNGWGFLSGNVLTVDFYYYVPGGAKVEDTFIGTKK